MREVDVEPKWPAVVILALLALAMIAWTVLGTGGDNMRRSPPLSAATTASADAGLRAPSNVAAQLLSDGSSARVTWTPVDTATNYRVGWVDINEIARSDTSSATWLDPILYHDLRGTSRSEFVVRNLPPGSRYYFFVGAYHRSGRHNEVYWATDGVARVDTAQVSQPAPPATHSLTRIDSVDLRIDRSAAGLGYLVVRYTLPSYCYSYRDVRFGQQGDEFSVDLLIDVYDGFCAQAQHSGTLLVWTNRRDLKEGRAYTVVVNGEHRLQVIAELRSESQSR